jgi:hypothetical protein
MRRGAFLLGSQVGQESVPFLTAAKNFGHSSRERHFFRKVLGGL